MSRLTRIRPVLALPLFTIALAPALHAQEDVNPAITAEEFIRPADHITDAVLAPRYLNVTLSNPSPDGRWFLRERSGGMPTQALFARPFYRLGGEEIDWRANRNRRFTTRSGVGIDIIDGTTGAITTIDAPDGARVSSPRWSPDGQRVAYFAHTETETHLYVADPSNGRARQVTRDPLLATLHTTFAWTPDSRSIVTVVLPENRGAPPAEAHVPVAPQVRITTPEKNRIRTYPDLLEDAHERALLEYYSTGQLAVVDVQNRRTRRVGPPAMIAGVDVSPDGMYALVTTMQEPFSYIVPRRQFGTVQAVWNLDNGQVLAQVTEQALRDGAPADTSDAEPEMRNVSWRPDAQGLSFLQMEPRGDSDSTDTENAGNESSRSARRQDRVFQWLPPFTEDTKEVIYESDARLQSVRYAEDAETLFLTQQQGNNAHDFAVRLSDPDTRTTIWRGERRGGFFNRGTAPRLLTKNLPNGASVVRASAGGTHVFLTGTDRSENPIAEGPTTYIDRVELESGDKTRVYESDNDGVYERVLEVMNDDATELVVSREGPTDVPDSFYRNVSNGELRQITQNVDYTPDLTRAQRRRYNIKRVDGFELALNVTLPENWSGERLPGMIWFYPREYTDQDSYDETRERYNKNSFPNVGTRSMEILIREGYAVIQPDAPIVGESGRMNDNYVHDLRNNLSAVIDFLDGEGIIDRQRLGVGGHSYGAFSTVNAMVHTPFFKAGIAGDGNYNRTLTPFAFQSERRSLWQARDVYFSMSPFFYANNLSGALLMYHGEHDQNVGTFPIHSWRLFEALEFLGKTGSLYFYPYEGHGPATEETVLDLWGRWTAWLDRYVKNAGERDARVTTDGISEQ